MVIIDGNVVKNSDKVVVVETEREGEGMTKIPAFVSGRYGVTEGQRVSIECLAKWKSKDGQHFELNLFVVAMWVAKGDQWVEVQPAGTTRTQRNKR